MRRQRADALDQAGWPVKPGVEQFELAHEAAWPNEGDERFLGAVDVGGHFQVGYVWALPEGGYEFGVFWAVMIAVFAVLGGGRNSADRELWRSEPARRLLPSVVWKVLAS